MSGVGPKHLLVAGFDSTVRQLLPWHSACESEWILKPKQWAADSLPLN